MITVFTLCINLICASYPTEAACETARNGTGRCDIYERIIENEPGSVAPILAPLPVARP